LTVEDLVALLVDDRALLVHDVVVFEDVLPGREVHGLDLALSALDGAAHDLGLDGHVLREVGLLHHLRDALHAVACEEAHELVLEREVEDGGTRVTLTAGTTAELVVYA